MMAINMLVSRRTVLQFAGVALAPWNAIRLVAASDFWNTKDPDAWTHDEVAKLLKKSPWAKEVIGERSASQKKR